MQDCYRENWKILEKHIKQNPVNDKIQYLWNATASQIIHKFNASSI